MANPIIELRGVDKQFGNYNALHKIDLEVLDGEILTLLGPSGCGKTTLMRLIAGFDRPTNGDISIRGKVVTSEPPERRPVNMVFQRYALFPHLDVFDNVAFGLRLQKVPKPEIRERVRDVLALVQLSDYGDRWIDQLSGGQAQRVALARALVNRPAVLLLDEPLAALDLKIRQHMLLELKRLHLETKTTFVYVTHDQDEAMILSDRIVLLNKGSIEQIDSPENMYAFPKTSFCARFLGESNFLRSTVSYADSTHTLYDTACGLIDGRAGPFGRGRDVMVSIRPETILISAPGDRLKENSFIGFVGSVTFIGSRIVYEVKLKDETVLKCQQARSSDVVLYREGDNVTVSWSRDSVTALAN